MSPNDESVTVTVPVSLMPLPLGFLRRVSFANEDVARVALFFEAGLTEETLDQLRKTERLSDGVLLLRQSLQQTRPLVTALIQLDHRLSSEFGIKCAALYSAP